MLFNKFYNAAKSGDISILSSIFRSGVPIDEFDQNGLTPLQYAVNFGLIEAVQWLLWKGADPNIISSNGLSSLHLGAIRGNEKCIEAIICRKANINVRDNNGCAPGHLAAIHGNSYSIEILLRGGADIHATDKDGWTMLHKAAYHGRVGCVQRLIKWRLHVSDKTNSGHTAVHLAAMEGHLAVVQYLLLVAKNWATVLEDCNDFGQTPKMLANQYQKHTVVAFIEQVEWSRKLTDDNNHGNSQISSIAFPGHVAAVSGDMQVLSGLIAESVIRINERDDQGSTLLHKAAESGKSECVVWLLDNGAKAEILNDAGESVVDAARRCGQTAILRILGHITENGVDSEACIEKHEIIDTICDEDLLPCNLPFGDTEGDGFPINEADKQKARNRALRRIQLLVKYLNLAMLDYRQLGGQSKELDKRIYFMNDEWKRRTTNMDRELEVEREKRENLEAALDECHREIVKLKNDKGVVKSTSTLFSSPSRCSKCKISLTRHNEEVGNRGRSATDNRRY